MLQFRYKGRNPIRGGNDDEKNNLVRTNDAGIFTNDGSCR